MLSIISSIDEYAPPADGKRVQEKYQEWKAAHESFMRVTVKILDDYVYEWQQNLERNGIGLGIGTEQFVEHRPPPFTIEIMERAAQILEKAARISPVGKEYLEYQSNLLFLKARNDVFGLIRQDVDLTRIVMRSPELKNFGILRDVAEKLGHNNIVVAMDSVRSMLIPSENASTVQEFKL